MKIVYCIWFAICAIGGIGCIKECFYGNWREGLLDTILGVILGLCIIAAGIVPFLI